MSNIEEVRIVLLGKTGAGKSAAGNTILGGKHFNSKISAASVSTFCDKSRCVVSGQSIVVVDTPGLFDTVCSLGDQVKQIKKCMDFSAPGPHVFLLVMRIGLFSREEQQTVKIIQDTFGEEAANYCMVLFTHGDQLEKQSIENYIGENSDLSSVVGQCEGGYHVFNNRDKDPTQVTELLKKINNLVQRNGGSHYTNEMPQGANTWNNVLSNGYMAVSITAVGFIIGKWILRQ